MNTGTGRFSRFIRTFLEAASPAAETTGEEDNGSKYVSFKAFSAAMASLWDMIKNLVSGKQDKLVSGTNIKTINGQAVLGAGNINIPSYYDITDLSHSVPAVIQANGTQYEKTYRIDVGDTLPVLRADSAVRWKGGVLPTLEKNRTYIIRVVSNLATIDEFEEVRSAPEVPDVPVGKVRFGGTVRIYNNSSYNVASTAFKVQLGIGDSDVEYYDWCSGAGTSLTAKGASITLSNPGTDYTPESGYYLQAIRLVYVNNMNNVAKVRCLIRGTSGGASIAVNGTDTTDLIGGTIPVSRAGQEKDGLSFDVTELDETKGNYVTFKSDLADALELEIVDI